MKKIIIFIMVLFCFIPKHVFANELVPNAKSSVLIEASSGKIIFEKNKNKKLSIASMTKMVAQIIILEEIEKKNIKWDDIVTVSKNASDMGGSQIYLEEGEKMSVEDLMKGISVGSGNDATVAMAEYIAGSEEKFVKKMNLKVKELGLKNTHFSNCTGLDEKNHYSSSYDMAMIARDLVINHSEILRFSSIYEDYLREDSDNKFWLVNTNKLISQYEGTDGLKTGHTDDAGYCLAATVKRNNLRLIGIVLGEENSKIRNAETIELLDYGFNNIKMKKLRSKGEFIDSLSVNNSNISSINGILDNDLLVLEEIDNKNTKYKYVVDFNDITLPVKKGEIIGKINVFSNKKIVATQNIVSDCDAIKLSLFDFYIFNLKKFFNGDF